MAQRSKQSAAQGAAPARNGRGAESQRQAEVLQLAAGLFARDGYNATTVRDIADAAGILSGSLYHHFRSKEAMADAILTAFLDDILGRYDEIVAAGGPARETFEALATASLLAMEQHQEAIVIYQNDGRHLAQLERFGYLADAGRRFEQAWVGVLERGIEEGEFRRSLDPRLTYRFIRATLWTVARWYRPGGPQDAQQIADQYLSILLDGIARSKKKKAKD